LNPPEFEHIVIGLWGRPRVTLERHFQSFPELREMTPSFLVPIKRSGDASPIFFVPSAGTTVLSLARFARSIVSPHPFHAFEFLDLPTGAARPATIEQMASLCFEAIRAVQETGPYFIGGHCWGGVVAFEIAARIEATSGKVATVLLLESVPPTGDDITAGGTPPPDRAETAKAVSDQRDQIRDRLAQVPPELATRFGPLAWELIDLALRYRATTRIDAPVFLIRTPTHPKTVFQNWGQLTNGGFQEQVVPGDAFSMLSAPIVDLVCKKLAEALSDYGS
jgi:thioesterase domain-containing protein